MSRATASVWAIAQEAPRIQRRDRYLAESTAHPGKMAPELARQAIKAYSRPGDLVVDPMCGIGTTLVEAAHLGRRALGLELEPRWARLAGRNARLATRQGAPGEASAFRGDARRLGDTVLREAAGEVALILTSPPYGPSTHGQVRLQHDRIQNLDVRYSNNPDNLAYLPPSRGMHGRPAFAAALAEILERCRVVLRRGGHLVITARPYRRDGALIDLPGELVTLASSAGFVLKARHAALLCGLRGDGLIPRASFFQMQKARSGAFPRMLVIAHEDVLVFTPQRRLRR